MDFNSEYLVFYLFAFLAIISIVITIGWVIWTAYKEMRSIDKWWEEYRNDNKGE